MGRCLRLERCSWLASMNETEKTPDEVCPRAKTLWSGSKQLRMALEAQIVYATAPKVGMANENPSSTKFISAKFARCRSVKIFVPRKIWRYTVKTGNLWGTTFRWVKWSWRQRQRTSYIMALFSIEQLSENHVTACSAQDPPDCSTDAWLKAKLHTVTLVLTLVVLPACGSGIFSGSPVVTCTHSWI